MTKSTRLWPLCFLFACFGIAFAAEPCAPIDGLEPLLKPGRILLLGEIHGTQESPAFALDVACHAAHSDLPVIVGLELRSNLQSEVNAFLDSEGSEADRSALLSGSQWRWNYQDGRASRAMFDLIDGLRHLRRAGLAVRIVMFDESGSGGGQVRDRAMAGNLAAAAATAKDAMMIVLTGNHHSRVTVGSARSATFEPMGYVLGQATSFERIVALNVAHGGGSAWVCNPDCGVSRFGGHHGDRRWAVEIDEATRPAGHQGWYHVGTIEASTPARFSPDEAAEAMSVIKAIREAAKPKTAETTKAPSPEPEQPTGLDDSPVTEVEQKIQGEWQAYDEGSKNKTWKFTFTGRRFHAVAGADDTYEGHISIRPDENPPQIDFAIEDCRCSYAGQTSQAIYTWDDEALIVYAPRPGSARPKELSKSMGGMMTLIRLTDD